MAPAAAAASVALLLAALLGGLGGTLAKYSIEEASLKVLFPSDSKRTMTMALADFGEPKYGGILKWVVCARRSGGHVGTRTRWQ